jgi:two-component system response regulator RegX3
MAAGKRRILLVEDEASIVQPLADALAREGFDPHVAGTAAEGIDLGRSLEPDLVLLDLMLPDGSGFDVCRELRRSSDVPIVMLTARGDEADRVVGLELGADDYVVKPFSAREVIARIRAVLRRAGPASSEGLEGPIEIGDLRLDPDRRTAEHAGEPIELARKEFELLHRLMREPGKVITREQLIEDVWDMNWFGSTKTLDVHVSNLRRKLDEDPGEPRYIHTVRGVGFRFAAPQEAAG